MHFSGKFYSVSVVQSLLFQSLWLFLKEVIYVIFYLHKYHFFSYFSFVSSFCNAFLENLAVFSPVPLVYYFKVLILILAATGGFLIL